MTAPTTPTIEPAPMRHATVLRFLQALAGPGDADELTELRFRRSDGHRMAQVFEPPERLRRLASRAVTLGRRTDV